MTPSTTADPGLGFASSRLRKLERVSGQNAVERRAITHLQSKYPPAKPGALVGERLKGA